MLDFLVTYAPMMRWGKDASQSGGYGMMGRHWGLVNGMMGWGEVWVFWVWQVLCLVTWVLVAMVLVALFRWLWKKGSK